MAVMPTAGWQGCEALSLLTLTQSHSHCELGKATATEPDWPQTILQANKQWSPDVPVCFFGTLRLKEDRDARPPAHLSGNHWNIKVLKESFKSTVVSQSPDCTSSSGSFIVCIRKGIHVFSRNRCRMGLMSVLENQKIARKEPFYLFVPIRNYWNCQLELQFLNPGGVRSFILASKRACHCFNWLVTLLLQQ